MGHAALDITGAAIRNFSPLTITYLSAEGGTAQERAISFVKTLTPSPFTPIVDIATNLNWLGSPIARPAAFTSPDDLQSQITKPGQDAFYNLLAETLNEISGGDASRLEKGFLDFQPSQYKHIAEYYLGGIMQFSNNLADDIQGEIAGVPVDPKKKYFKRIFTKQEQNHVYKNRFYTVSNDILSLAKNIRDMEDKEYAKELTEKNKNILALAEVDPAAEAIYKELPIQVRRILSEPNSKILEVKKELKELREREKTLERLEEVKRNPTNYTRLKFQIEEAKIDAIKEFLKIYEEAKEEDQK